MGRQVSRRRVRLYRVNGDIVAVVEAKRTSIDPRLSEAHAQQREAERQEHLFQTLLHRAFRGEV